ncbi:MAG: HEAT repeat domain-containing protein [Gemmataceae bacterium]|nr:HEAT repeat domain-containing protein [Gemmataceae bacterium]
MEAAARLVRSPWLAILCLSAGINTIAHAYITAPVSTLGAAVVDSTYVTVLRVDKVNKERGIIIYRKVRDLKGKYPKELVKHIFDLKGTPAHRGPGDVPVRPNEKDWNYALQWAEPGKTAVMLTRKYDPYGDFGHTYIDGCWYATMCPPRDWEFWYAIYADPNLLARWHAGPPEKLIPALEALSAGKDGVALVLSKGTRDDLRAGRAKLQRLRVSLGLRDYVAQRDLIPDPPHPGMIPELLTALRSADRNERLSAAQRLGQLGPSAKSAVPVLAEVVRQDASGTVRIAAADALAAIGKDAKSALPALEAALQDPRMAHRQDVLSKLAAVRDKLK